MGRTICSAFQDTAARIPDAPALRTPGGQTVSWGEYAAAVERCARRLAGLGVRSADTVGLMLANRPEFHILDLAAAHVGATPFSIYTTFTAEQVSHVVQNAGCRVLVHEPQFAERLPAVEHRVELEQFGELAPDHTFDFEAGWREVRPEAIATLIYTSGTTGAPKGVMLSHANLLAAWAASLAAVPALGQRGRYVSYLPHAHLADRMFSHYPAAMTGSEITCVDDPRAAIGHLRQIRPTLLLAVPRIWEKLKDAVEALLATDPRARIGVAERLGLADADLLASGAAPIRPEVLEFFSDLGIEICEGYGMSESTAIGTLNLPGATRIGTVGRPLPGIECRLADDGEVLLRGPSVMVGYRNAPAQTAEAIDRDGWLHTGDIGAFADGHLRIIDRKKELIINAAGKNMSPANIESRIKNATPLVAHAIAIGDNRPYNTALLVLDPDVLALGSAAHGRSVDEALELAVAQANSHLSRVEQIKRFTVLEEEWLPGGEALTPTLKPKRKAIAARYAEEIEAMYQAHQQPQGAEA